MMRLILTISFFTFSPKTIITFSQSIMIFKSRSMTNPTYCRMLICIKITIINELLKIFYITMISFFFLSTINTGFMMFIFIRNFSFSLSLAIFFSTMRFLSTSTTNFTKNHMSYWTTIIFTLRIEKK